MDQHELKARCLALPGAVEDFPFGDEVSVFKVGGKMFALCALDGEPLQLSAKCEPDLAVQLRATYPAIAPGYHLNKRHWNTITLDGSLPDQMVTDMLGDSYDLVVASLPKKQAGDRAHTQGPGGAELNARQQGTLAAIYELDQQADASHRQAGARGEFDRAPRGGLVGEVNRPPGRRGGVVRVSCFYPVSRRRWLATQGRTATAPAAASQRRTAVTSDSPPRRPTRNEGGEVCGGHLL